MKLVKAAVFLAGFSAVVMQLAVLREFFAVFYGNELVFGIILGNWLLLTGLGGFLGRFAGRLGNKLYWFILLQAVLGLIAPAVILFAGLSRSIFSLPGEMASLPLVAVSSFFVLLPFCMVSGFQIVLAVSLQSKSDDNIASGLGGVYAIEGFGSLAGGVLYTYFLIPALNSLEAAMLVLVLNMALCILMSLSLLPASVRKISAGAIALLLIASLLAINNTGLAGLSDRMQYPGQEIILREDSPYGRLFITRTGSQLNFYENGLPLFTTDDIGQSEEAVHYAMVQHSSPRKVLVISGGVSGVLNEILKYPSVEEIDYVELDPLLIDAGRLFVNGSGIESPKVRVHYGDGRRFVQDASTSGSGYDVILLNLPDPSTAQLSRFYTVEFFRQARKLLGERGVISLSISGSENYMNTASLSLNACVYRTLLESFRNAIILPGGRNYYLASDGSLTYDIAGRLSGLGIQTSYVNGYYLPGILTGERIRYATDSVTSLKAEVSHDFKPASYSYYIAYWSSQYGINLDYLGLLLLIMLLLFFLWLKPVPGAVFSAGFAGTSLQLSIILAFQALYGYAYRQIGAIVAAFMLGLMAGSLYSTMAIRSRKQGDLRILVAGISIYSFIIAACLMLASYADSAGLPAFLLPAVFLLASMISGMLTGALFPIAGKISLAKNPAAESAMGALYAADMAGAFFGSLLTGVFLAPVYGIITATAAAGLLALAGWMKLASK
ncbi:MAG: hypothetical protein PHG85_00555 [Candidatus Altiarchaeota archaeon]|nr:hypothetical protein [Candidatus Altiarchaeota archaeon]